MKNAPEWARYDCYQGQDGEPQSAKNEINKDQKARMGRDIRSNCEIFPGQYIPAEIPCYGPERNEQYGG
jgi:hypothetical protein